MVTFLQAVILGIIQGITEWLPVSSSGHLALAQFFLGIEASVFYDILLHIGTLLVVCIVFREDILKILKAAAKLDFKSEDGKLGLYIILASIPTALIGFTFHDLFSSFFSNLNMIAFALIFTSGILLASKFAKPKREINWWNSLLIGISQGIAIIPGISRSGATISTGMLAGIDRLKAARFSFLLSIPAVIGAALFEAKAGIGEINLGTGLVGFVVAMIVGYLSIKLLLKIIEQKKFHYFAYYCFILGGVLLAAQLL